MTGLRDLLKKKENIRKAAEVQDSGSVQVPEFKFIRTTTESEEVIEPPSFPDDEITSPKKGKEKEHRRRLNFRKSSNPPPSPSSKDASSQDEETQPQPARPRIERSISERLHLRGSLARSKSSDSVSTGLPQDLPTAPDSVALPADAIEGATPEKEKEVKTTREAQWEARATILAASSPLAAETQQRQRAATLQGTSRSRDKSPSIGIAKEDVNIQEAIRLHESGDLERSTKMFGELADPAGANDALSQVLYGLALRHGWGLDPEPEKAIHYLSLAASNAAAVEKAALAAGMKTGGAAKGELVLAMFELANCFRQGWGVKKDPVAARNYYETAANLGDTDAMEEAARCYLDGFGGEKDKFKAAQYLRLAEQKGSKTVGNSWIWKEKYNPR